MATTPATQDARFTLFDKSTVKTLVNMKGLLEELLETLDITSDPLLLSEISEAEQEVRAGKVRHFRDFA